MHVTTNTSSTRSADIQIHQNNIHYSNQNGNHHENILPVFPIMLQHPFVRSRSDTSELGLYLNQGIIPSTHENRLEIASWCAQYYVEHKDETELKKAFSYLVATSEIDELSFTGLSEIGMDHLISLLEEHKTITGILLLQSTFNAEQIVLLLKNTSIQSLGIPNSNLGPEGGVTLANALKGKNIKQLILSDCKLDPEGVKAICFALRGNAMLSALDLSDNGFGIEGARAVAEMLNDTAIEVLLLNNNNLSPAGGKLICDALQGHKTINKLGLRSNNLGYDGYDGCNNYNGLAAAKAIANMINKNTSLIEIDLSLNDFYSSGSSSIFNALKHNKTLKTLHLYGSKICTSFQFQVDKLQNEAYSDMPVCRNIYKIIADMLRENRHLETLNIGCNTFGRSGLFQIMKGLYKNNTLRSLLLGYKNRDYLEISAIAHMLTVNKGLKLLSLAFAMVGQKEIKVLAGALQSSSCTLKLLDLYGNFIGATGKSILASALTKPTSSLHNIDIDNNIASIYNPDSTNSSASDEIENACARNRLKSAVRAEAFGHGAFTGLMQSWDPYWTPSKQQGTHPRGRLAHDLAEYLASFMDPEIALTSNLSIVNKATWKMAGEARNTATKNLLAGQAQEMSLSRLHSMKWDSSFSCKKFDFLHATRSEMAWFSFVSNTKIIDRSDTDSDTLFLRTARNGDLETIQFLINAGIDPDQTYHDGSTALLEAVRGGHLPVVQYLIDKLSDPHAADLYGCTPLEAAAKQGSLEMVQFLTGKEADPKQGRSLGNPDTFGYTPLMAAAQYGHLEIVKFFIEDNKIDPNQTDARGWTPLQHAAVAGSLDIVQFLISKNADVNSVNLFGSTALTLATQKGSLPIIELLIKHGANVNHANSRGFTPLYIAAHKDNSYEEKERDLIIFSLMKNGAHLDSDFYFFEDDTLDNKAKMYISIGKIWLRILTAPTALLNKKKKGEKLDSEELSRLTKLENDAQTLIDRLKVLSKDAIMDRFTAVVFASVTDSASQSLNDHPYLIPLFDIPQWDKMPATLSKNMRLLDCAGENQWGDGKTGIFNIGRNQLPAMTQSMLEKLNIN